MKIPNYKRAVFLLTWIFCTTLLYSQEQQATFRFSVAQDSFVARGYQISKKINGEWKAVGKFSLPTVSMLLQYRPNVRSHFGFDQDREGFVDVVNDVSSAISAACEADGKIWVGFDFYEGEGCEGYGGIGFYDIEANEIGVLRHPALIDYSVKSILVTDTMLYVQTVGEYELSSTVGNGLVMINTRTLFASAIVPPGTSTLWDKDDPANVGPLYNRSIPEILSDRQFINKPMPQYSSVMLDPFQPIGLDSFMVQAAEEELAIRNRAASKAKRVKKDVFTFSGDAGRWTTNGNETGIGVDGGPYLKRLPQGGVRVLRALECPIDGIPFIFLQVAEAFEFSENFVIRPATMYPDLFTGEITNIVGEQGESWTREDFRRRLVFSIDKLNTQTKSCTFDGQSREFQYFTFAIVRAEVWELQE